MSEISRLTHQVTRNRVAASETVHELQGLREQIERATKQLAESNRLNSKPEKNWRIVEEPRAHPLARYDYVKKLDIL